jgi:hypothetical protein
VRDSGEQLISVSIFSLSHLPHPNPLPKGEGTKNLPQKAPRGRGNCCRFSRRKEK